MQDFFMPWEYQWQNWWFLLLLPIIPFLPLIKKKLRIGKNIQLAYAFEVEDIKNDSFIKLRYIPITLFLLSLFFCCLTLARPVKVDQKVERWAEGIDIILILDISESMRLIDFQPNRLEAAKEVAKRFIDGRFQDRIGLVLFAGEALPYVPLTTDYKLLKKMVDEVDFKLSGGTSGTAIGNALTTGTGLLEESEAKSKVMILLSDGENTAGNVDPINAAKLSNALIDSKIYTIGIGKEGKVPIGKDAYGTVRYMENTFDDETLRQIASIGEGEFFRVQNNKALLETFKKIDKYEKTEIKENRFQKTTDHYQLYLWACILFFLLWLLSRATFLQSGLQD